MEVQYTRKPCITFEDVDYRYGTEEWGLKGINFSVYPGEWVTVVGANGSGKSTMAQLMNGLLIPTKGQVCVFGKDTCEEENRWEVHRKVGMVFQNPDHQIVAITVEDDMAFGLENLEMSQTEIERRLHEVMGMLGLSSLKGKEPHTLSPGQKQKLAIAGVLVMEPEVIIFDEPASMLDARSASDVYQIMSALHRKGTTIIHITHDMEQLFDGGRIAVMGGGTVLLEINPRDIWNNYSVIQEAGLSIPFAVRIRNALTEEGIEMERDVTTLQDLVEHLWTSHFMKSATGIQKEPLLRQGL